MLWPGKVQRTGENSCLMIAQRVSVPASVIQSSCSGSVSWKSDCRKDARQKNLQRLLSFDITSVWFPPRDQSIMAVLLVEYHLDDQLLVNGKWNGIELLSCYIMSATDSFIRLEIILNVWKRAWANVFARWKGTLTETKIKLRSSEEACTISRGTPKQVRTLQHALTASGNLIPKTSWYLKLKLGSTCTNPQEAVPSNWQKGGQKERLCLARTGSLTGKECFLVFRRFVCCGDLCLQSAASRATTPFTSPETR